MLIYISTSQNGQDLLVPLGEIKSILVARYEEWAAQHPEEASAVDAGLNVQVKSRADQCPDYHESSWRAYQAVGRQSRREGAGHMNSPPHSVVEQKTSCYHGRPQMGPASSRKKDDAERPLGK